MMRYRFILAIALSLHGLVIAAAPLAGFPGDVTLPPDVRLYGDSPSPVVPEDFAEVEFVLPDGKTEVKQGKHWRAYLQWNDATNKPVAATAPQWLASLKANGWELLSSHDEGRGFTLRKIANGQERWLRLAMGDYDSPLIEIIATGSAADVLVLASPAAIPETIAKGADFPYLGKPSGAQFSGEEQREEPLNVTAIGSDHEEQLAGLGYRIKFYRPPASLSRLAFETSYRAALEKAGWQVKPPDGGKPGEGRVVAHYTGNGRNLWAVLGRGADDGDTGIALTVADLGAEDWAQALKKVCHVPLYGLVFDFNKASLMPDSTPVLEKLLGVLKHEESLSVDVQGHTDNIGGATYNQTLSEARANTVKDWLIAHGVATTRLSSHGYGLTQPVADNDSDAGRARNRRVEIVRRGCGT